MERPWLVRNLPNLFTASRIAVPLTSWLAYRSLRNGHTLEATIWVIATGLLTATDFIDGRLARRMGVVSEFGKQLDPILDKVVLLAIFGFLAAAIVNDGTSDWLLAAVTFTLGWRVVQEMRLAVWARRSQKAGLIPGANWNGKVKFCFDCLAAALGWALLIWGGPHRASISAAAFSLTLLGAIYYGAISLSEYNRQLAAA